MIIEQLENGIITITAEDGKYITKRENVNNNERQFALSLVLGDNDSPDNYEEWDASVAEPIMAKQERTREELRDAQMLNEAIIQKVKDIQAYDTSDSINVFYYNNEPFWLDKATRVGLVNSTNAEVRKGRENTTLILGLYRVILPCTALLDMLDTIEVYAKDCYNATSEHIINVSQLTRVQDVEAYNYTTGYPEIISF